ncbi:hypothetical protein FRC11_005888 [Ceratobasidium sp. 423]|nr:hypothetical protein FRC11_005888 [Ceratobasidium sp. 423]
MRLPLSLSHVGLFAIAAAGHVMAATGGSFCGTLVCVSGTISGSQTIYTLNTTASFANLGWMAVGFGQRMIGSPMVIMWANDNGSLVLSQRQATAHAEPQVVSSPPRVATVRSDLSSLTGSAITFSFSMPARFLRIWWPMWFKTHWIVQAGLAGPFIVAGFALAVNVIQEAGIKHFNDTHTIIGLVLFLLYVCQALYGLIIHIVKNPYRRRRPIQNYGHAILGLGVIALSLYQVWLGFNHEWPSATGRDKPAQGLRTFWIVWVVVIGGAYIIGLALVPKQYRTERYAVQDGGKNMTASDINVHPMSTRGA